MCGGRGHCCSPGCLELSDYSEDWPGKLEAIVGQRKRHLGHGQDGEACGASQHGGGDAALRRHPAHPPECRRYVGGLPHQTWSPSGSTAMRCSSKARDRILQVHAPSWTSMHVLILDRTPDGHGPAARYGERAGERQRPQVSGSRSKGAAERGSAGDAMRSARSWLVAARGWCAWVGPAQQDFLSTCMRLCSASR